MPHGLWQNLNPDNKVSLFARVIDLDSGETGDMIFNKYDAVNSDLDDPEELNCCPRSWSCWQNSMPKRNNEDLRRMHQ